ncbi:hypothetical protein Hamer_G006890, partial [Homarus americanus]
DRPLYARAANHSFVSVSLGVGELDERNAVETESAGEGISTVKTKGCWEAKTTVGQRGSSDCVSSSNYWGSSKQGGVETVGTVWEGVGVEGRQSAVDGGEEAGVGGDFTIQVGVGGGFSTSCSGVKSSLEVSLSSSDFFSVFNRGAPSGTTTSGTSSAAAAAAAALKAASNSALACTTSSVSVTGTGTSMGRAAAQVAPTKARRT